MSIFAHCLKGLVSVLTISSSPLYRYPYRYPGEAFRGDWQRLGKDLLYAMDRWETEQGSDGHGE